MVPHSSILAWRIPWKRSLAGYSPWGHRVDHDSETEHTHNPEKPRPGRRRPWEKWLRCPALASFLHGLRTHNGSMSDHWSPQRPRQLSIPWLCFISSAALSTIETIQSVCLPAWKPSAQSRPVANPQHLGIAGGLLTTVGWTDGHLVMDAGWGKGGGRKEGGIEG